MDETDLELDLNNDITLEDVSGQLETIDTNIENLALVLTKVKSWIIAIFVLGVIVAYHFW